MTSFDTGMRRAAGGWDVALWDVRSGVTNWRLWAFFGWQDIRQRYRRSLLGPLWMALGLGVTIIGIGLLYAAILRTAPGEFIPFVASGLLAWQLIAGVLIESTALFQSGASIIKTTRIPYTSLVLRAFARNFIIFLHCIVPAAIAFAVYNKPVGINVVFAIPGLLLTSLNLLWMGLALGIVCARFRDVQQMIIYIIQVAVFLTPIIWMPTSLRPGSALIMWNPFFHLIEAIRGPVFGNTLPLASFAFLSGMLVVGVLLTLLALKQYRSKIIYWI